MKNLVLFLLVFFSVNTFAQLTIKSDLILFPQGYGLNLLNSSGNSSIVNDVSNISFMNPAAITGLKNYSAAISYQFNTDLKEAWIADIGMKRIYNFFPQSFGAVAKYGNFSFGLGLGQRYNGTKEFGKIPITTPDRPDGTGEFIELREKNTIQSYSLSTAYSLSEVLQSSFDIQIGLKYSLNYLRHSMYILYNNINAKGYYSSFSFGITSLFDLDEERFLQLGLSYEISSELNVNPQIDIDLLSIPDPNNRTNYYLHPIELFYKSPSELNFNIAVDATNDLMFLGGLRAVFWSSQKEYFKNQLEFSLSGLYKFSEIVKASLGFYSTDFKNENFSSLELGEEFNAFFLTTGLNLNISIISIDLALADSHLFSGKFTKQTILKLAAGVQL
ncbi:MAG: hypothetical protein B6D44_16790 [Ignavibacteriales bacterium UTCHB2]|nr:MAG: hypothetical protein BWY38_01005 [Ignavibacteria bacterium ADurb.Bin266]OQY69952.1 MAG: hypothetical protein B6D44_16790 [Ignavibacteriales bacterium UTCHB2]